MTAEKLVEDYMKNIKGVLDKEDAAILEAWVAVETDRRVKASNRTFMVFDYGSSLLAVALVIAVLGSGFAFLYNADAKGEGYRSAMEEQNSLVEAAIAEQKLASESRSETLKRELFKAQSDRSAILLHKDEYCRGFK